MACTDVHHRRVEQALEDRSQAGRSGRVVNGEVKVAVVVYEVRGLRICRHLVVDPGHPFDHLIGHSLHGLAHCGRLEDGTYVVDLDQLFATELMHDTAPMSVQPDHPLRCEVAQGLTYRGRAHLQHVGNVGLDQTRPAGQTATENRGA